MNYYRTDNAGNVPKVGDYVAYNWSGQLATGYIVSLGIKRHNPIYHIQRVLPPKEDYDDGISRVRGGAKCLLVLEPADE